MAMSRRKQLHPKSLKGTLELGDMSVFILQFDILFCFEEGDETIFILPDELKYDDEVS